MIAPFFYMKTTEVTVSMFSGVPTAVDMFHDPLHPPVRNFAGKEMFEILPELVKSHAIL